MGRGFKKIAQYATLALSLACTQSTGADMTGGEGNGGGCMPLPKGEHPTAQYIDYIKRCIPDLVITSSYENPNKEKKDQPGTIFILPDTHGSPEIEQEKIKLLQQNFGIRFVGVEGWAGEKVDRERGYVAMNAEEDLTKWLLKQKEKFTAIGLEDPQFQNMQMTHLFYQWTELALKVKKMKEKLEKNLQEADYTIQSDNFKQYPQVDQEKIFKTRNKIVEKLGVLKNDINNLYLNIHEIQKEHFPQDKIPDIFERGKIIDSTLSYFNEIIDIRSVVGVQRLLEHVPSNEDSVMVFGEDHLPVIQEKLQQERRGYIVLGDEQGSK